MSIVFDLPWFLVPIVLSANNQLLEILNCSSNKLKQLDVSQNNSLRGLDCSGNALKCLNVRNGNEISGYCFTPQDGNSLLSSISIAEWFMYPNSYEDKVQYLKPFFFDEV